MLSMENINVCYGKVQVIYNVSIKVKEKETVVIVGANGAGKTTIMNTITGIITPASGRIVFNDKTISANNCSIQEITQRGIRMCPQGRMVFPWVSVHKNLELGAYLLRKDRNLFNERIEAMYEMFPRLKERTNQQAGTLSGGEQQMLAIARAVVVKPKLLLLDEPSAGLAPLLIEEVFRLINELKSQGTTILLVEQMANLALQIADRAYVLETGEITMEGSGEDVRNDPAIIESYLGKKK